MRAIFLFSLFACMLPMAFSQVSDDFSDGDFSATPTWSGSGADFIINAAQQVQLNNTIAATSYLATPHLLASLNNKEWDIYVKQSFAGSSSNFGRIYLCADNADLNAVLNGYYIQIGEANAIDALRLYKVQAGVSSLICAGVDGQIVNSCNASIKVIRNNLGDWKLFADLNGGSNYILQGSGNDPSNLIGTHFGFSSTYTASNANKFYYDAVYIGDEILDQTAPSIDSAAVINANQMDLYYTEAISNASGVLTSNYFISPSLNISSLTQDATNSSLFHFTFSTAMTNGAVYQIGASNISDMAGNIPGILSTSFQYLYAEVVQVGDVLINEFFADPTPVIGLPEVEYVEIYNKSNKIFNLQDWHITDGSSSGTIANAWLFPGDYMILCATANTPLFVPYLTTSVTSFPSLNNAGDSVILKDNNGVYIDMLVYNSNWYHDEIKMDGGYSLELINPNDPCSNEDNWSSSNAALGGTPGQVNSIYDLSPDLTAPLFTELIALAPNYLEIQFNEGVDSTSIMNAVYTIQPNLGIQSIYIPGAYSTSCILQFNQNLIASQFYNIQINPVADCWLNNTNLSGQFVLAEVPLPGEIVINEILQNPKNGGSDWIELYNNSAKIFNLKNMEFANMENDTIANNKIIMQSHLLLPNGYAVVGKDSVFVKENYPESVTGTFVYSEMPSYNNDSGNVILISNYQIIDQVDYNNDWQFKLLDNNDGVSLERIDPLGLSSSSFNWHSAAEDIGFASPGRINSQFLTATMTGAFEFTNDVFSPDNDGFEDILQIHYKMEKEGLLGKASIYDDRGRLIRSLFTNTLLSSEGVFSWDGVSDQQVKASIGIYVLLFEAFSTDGSVFFTNKKACTLAGKL